jgi:hypothetical protein
MGLFDSPAVKELKSAARDLGGMCGSAHVGTLPSEALVELVVDPSFRGQFQAIFSAAVQDVGESKALKIANREARAFARIAPENRNIPLGNVGDRAEILVDQLLDPAFDS